MKLTLSKNTIGNILSLTVILGALTIFIFKVDPTKVIFKKSVEELKQPNITETLTKEQYEEVREIWKKQEGQTAQPISIEEIEKNEIKPPVEQYPQGTIFSIRM